MCLKYDAVIFEGGRYGHVDDHIASRILMVDTVRSNCLSLCVIAFISSAHTCIEIFTHDRFSASLLTLTDHIFQLIIKLLDLCCCFVLGVWCVHIDQGNFLESAAISLKLKSSPITLAYPSPMPPGMMG